MRKYIFGAAVFVILLGAVAGIFAVIYESNPEVEIRSPYVSQLDSPVRGLDSEEVNDLLNGRGAGFARSAELNGVPGPRHVLDMQQELELSPEVTEQFEAIFVQMQSQAKVFGEEIIHKESLLSRGFAAGTLSETEMREQVEELAILYGELRATHLQAHFHTEPLLSAKQVDQYNTLRGYTNTSGQPMPGNHPQHQGH